MDDFHLIPKIDAHIHYNSERPALLQQAKDDNFSLITINTNIPIFPSVDDQHAIATRLKDRSPNLINHIASFSVENFSSNAWVTETITSLQQKLSEGAMGVKIWKNIGMDLLDEKGRMVMIDDERFDPIFEYLEQNSIPVIGHLGEPKNCWLPLEEMTVDSDKEYFAAHPEYHMHLHPDFPSYEDQIEARDRMLAKFPKLRFTGAHLASLEWNIDEVGKRLDLYPKMSVDLAERICHLQYKALTDRDKVIRFIETYQDRIIYGTDVIDDGSRNVEDLKEHIHQLWVAHWEFFATDKELMAPEFSGAFQGLDLPASVLEKIFYKNAVNWFQL